MSRTASIIHAIRDADRRVRARSVWLSAEREDTVALIFYASAWAIIATTSAAYLAHAIPAAIAVVLVALGLSVLHELEHDLIHDLYFKGQRWVQDALFMGIFIAKGSLDPWSRRRLHRYHHRVSGQPEDIEERLIGLGLPWGPLRLALTLMPAASAVLVPRITRDVRRAVASGRPRPDLDHAPGHGVLKAMSHLFIAAPLIVLPAWLWTLTTGTGQDTLLDAICVLWVLPNIVRHASIVLLSSNSHYTAIEPGDLAVQNQILDHWLTWPLQVFCWGFGATHVVHHFVVKQPFWVRTLVYFEVREALVQHGIPRNDLGTFTRANHRPAA